VIEGFFHISAALFLAFCLTAQTPPKLADKAEILIPAAKTQDALTVLEQAATEIKGLAANSLLTVVEGIHPSR
jgi:hypothetical protein